MGHCVYCWFYVLISYVACKTLYIKNEIHVYKSELPKTHYVKKKNPSICYVSSRNILISCEYEQIYHANVCALITFERKEENNAQSYGSTL